jgi:DNA-binding IclR family transcriptional regulator
MTRDDIIRMAKEAGWKRVGRNPETGPEFPVLIGNLERFAALVAAVEREQCAKVCEDIPVPQDPTALTHIPTLERCAAAIRARGQ